MNNVENTLAQRGNRYGDFREQARITQNIKLAMRSQTNWECLTDDKREALEQIASKISRILNGDPEYWDSWHDIAGYATLAEKRCTNGPETTKG